MLVRLIRACCHYFARAGVPKLIGAREILGWLFVGFTSGFVIGCILGYRVGIYKGNGGE